MSHFSLSVMMPNAETVRRRTAWICRLFYASGLSRAFIKNERRRRRTPILLYHSIDNASKPGEPSTCFMAMGMVVEKPRFEMQMDYLARNATVVSLDKVAASLQNNTPLPADAVAITFDDGFRDNITVAAPILKKYGFEATFFPIGSIVDGSCLPWPHGLYCLLDAMQSKKFLIDLPGLPKTAGRHLDENGKLRLARQLRRHLELLPENERKAAIGKLCDTNSLPPEILHCEGIFMTEADLRQLISNGHAIGGHSMSHRDFTGLSITECDREAAMSRKFIESRGSGGFASFAYPYGAHNSSVRQMLRAQGFDCGVTTSEGLNDRKTDLFALRRIYMGNFGPAEFETHLSGAPALLLRLARGGY